MEPGVLMLVWSVVNTLIGGAAGIYAWHDAKRRADRAELQELRERLVSMEERVRAAPNAEAWGAMREDIAAIKGDVRAAAVEVHGLGAGLKRVEQQVSMLVENELKGAHPRSATA